MKGIVRHEVPLFSDPKLQRQTWMRMKEWWWMSDLLNSSHPELFCNRVHWDFPTKQGNISWWCELCDISLSANKWGKVEMGDFWLNFKKFQVHWICSVVKNVSVESKNLYDHNHDDKWKFQIQQNFVQREGEIAFQKFSKSNLRLKEVVPAKITKTWYFRGWFKICCLALLF